MSDVIKILVVEPSFVVREGLKTVLSRMGIGFRFEEEEEVRNGFVRMLERHRPRLLFINHQLSMQAWTGNRSDAHFQEMTIVGLHFGRKSDADCARYDHHIDLDSGKNHLTQQLHDVFIKADLLQAEDQTDAISERETDVLRLVALGYTNNEISDKLFISVHTVMTHRKNITRKLGIKTVSGLTVYAILNKIIQSGEVKGNLK